MRGIYLDPEAPVIKETYAVVYVPRRSRKRFAENTVQVFNSEEEALQSADPTNNLYAARVVGPARSSEGLRIFYLARWLDT